MIQHILLALVSANFAAFLWSVIGVFKKAPDQDVLGYRLLQWGSLATWSASLYALLMSQITLDLLVVGIVFQLLAGVLFWWAAYTTRKNKFTLAYSKDQPHQLVTTGPYRWIRHPFYTAYLLSYIGVLVVTQSLWLVPFVGLMVFVYVRAYRLEEKKFQASEFSEKYEAYRSRTGALWPGLGVKVARPEVKKGSAS